MSIDIHTWRAYDASELAHFGILPTPPNGPGPVEQFAKEGLVNFQFFWSKFFPKVPQTLWTNFSQFEQYNSTY